jgi:hypothetical protein
MYLEAGAEHYKEVEFLSAVLSIFDLCSQETPNSELIDGHDCVEC